MGGNARVSSHEDARAALQSTRSSEQAFTYSEQATRSGRGAVHEKLKPLNIRRECRDTTAMPRVTPIAFLMDVTRSRGKDAKIIYEQMMPFLGALHLSEAAVDPQLLFMCYGDVKSDRAPLQVGQFESDERMDHDLDRMWLEEGGGGTGEESAELAAYFLARKTDVDAIDKRKKKGFAFFTSDEAPYPKVLKDEVKRIIGDDIPKDIPTEKIFAELQKRYHTFLIYPATSMESRAADIDQEIRQRLLKAGGRFENCSIRASLIWNTYDDLDLHVVTPNKEHIFYASRRSHCGGELDVDQNGGRPMTNTPVENIRWAKGTAKPGKYTVYVQNYAHHESQHRDIPFKVELDIDGVIKTFEGVAKKNVTGPTSDIKAFEFTYEPGAGTVVSADNHEAYSEEVVLGKWRSYIPNGHIVRITDPRWTTEAAIGIMSLQSGKKDLAGVVKAMRERAVDPKGIEDVKKALTALSKQGVFNEVDADAFT